METLTTELEQKQKRKKSLISFVGSFLVSLTLTIYLKEPEFTDSQIYVLFLLFFSISLWLTEAIPAFAVSLFILAYLVFAMGNKHINESPEIIDKYVNTFSSSTIWLFLGGFFISAAMTKTKLDEKLLRFTLKVSGTHPRNILIALMTTTMVGSMLMSNTATTAMIVAAFMPLLSSLGRSGITKALLLGVSIAASTGGIGTIIGSPPNAIAVGILERKGIKVDFLEWMLYGLPLAIFLTGLCCWLLIKIYLKDAKPVSLEFLNSSVKDDVPKAKKNIVIAVIIVTVLLWLTSSLHDIKVGAVSAIPIVFLTLTGILNEKDMQTLPWDTLFLVAGGLSLGVALESTGILNYYAEKIKAMEASTIAILIIFAFISSLFANVATNAASSAVLIPMGTALIPGNEKELGVIVGITASMALFLTVSAPPNGIVYSTGLIEQKDFRLGGLVVGLLGPLLAVAWILLVV